MTGGICIPRNGGFLLAETLAAFGARRLACVPGESFLAFLDAAASRLEVLTCRHEAAAAHMADAWGKLTGRPGLCAVGRGPGACHAAVGLHTACQDSTPMILLVGDVPRRHRGREAFQETDLAALFSPLAKRVERVDSAARIPEAVMRAFAAALGGRPGPAVLILPEDVLAETAAVPLPTLPELSPSEPPAAVMASLAEMLEQAERPLAIVGGSGWTEAACRDFAGFALAWSLPVAAAFRCQDRIDNTLPVYAGELGFSMNPALGERLRRADLLLVAGARLSEVDTAGYTLVEAPQPRQTLVHAFPAAEELGRVFRPALGIAAAMPAFTAACRRLPAPARRPWQAWTRTARDDYEHNLIPGPCPGPLDLGRAMAVLESRLPADAILCTGAGNYTGWPQRFHRFRTFPSQLAPAGGTMGYGLPAALAAKAAFPARTVVTFAGDGCFLMSAQEMATAKLHGLAVLVIIVDNGLYGTIRMHQERHHPGHSPATTLANPDFAALARSYGFRAETVTRTEDFAPALDRALAAASLALLHLVVDPEAITTRTTLSALRADC